MAGLEEVTETRREGGTEEQSHPTGEDPPTRTGKNVRRNRMNSRGLNGSGGASSSGQSRANPKVGENGEPRGQSADGNKGGLELPQEDPRARFYEHYRKEAEEYDKEFMKRYDEDLNTTLIFAGLFSAVTSAFIIQVHSEFQPDSNEETAALLRVLIHKIDNTTFGDDVPTVPQWTGPTHTAVQAQAILLASLTASLFSAFLAMLGKQWLNRYASIDVRGSAIQRSQNRQRKLDGIVVWYFDHVMEVLPLMLQAALLLLGCALSHYLWEINTTVASVVLGVTSFGVLFYIFIVVAGAVSVSCPYQTPGAQVLRGIPDTLHRILDIFRHLLHIIGVLHSASVKESIFCKSLPKAWRIFKESPCSLQGITISFLIIPFLLLWLIADVCQLGRALVRGSVGFFRGVYSQLQQGSASFLHWVYSQLWHGLEHRTDVLNMHCILWALRTSLDGPVRLSVLNYLATIALADLDPTLVIECFNVLLGCVKVTGDHMVITQGLEQLARASALCFLQTLSHLTAIDPTSRVLEDVRQRYTATFPLRTDLSSLPFSHILTTIHCVFYQTLRERARRNRRGAFFMWRTSCRWVQWGDYELFNNEHITLAHALTKLARSEYQRGQREKVPRGLLRFALHFLSQVPLPPTSVIADCLSIIAIDLDCTFPNATTPDESSRLEDVSRLITRKLATMAQAEDQQLLHAKHKAASCLFPYVVWQDRVGQREMLGALLHAAMTSNSERFMWRRIQPYITTLSNKPSPPSLDQVIVFASPHVSWHDGQHNENMVTRWGAAASAVPYTEEVGQSVVDALLQIASVDSLRPHIPIETWAWLRRRPSLLPECSGRSKGTDGDIVRQVRTLGDIEVLKSYLLLVWSEWDPISPRSGGLAEMHVAIRERFNGIGMGRHREDLIKRLDHVLGQLDWGLLEEHRSSLGEDDTQRAKEQYEELKKVLLEVDREAVNVLAQSHSIFTCALPLPCP